MGSVAISVKQLCFQYPKSTQQVLNSVSFDCIAGQCTGLIGPNGAGKSTLISLLSGLLTTDKGSVEYKYAEQLNHLAYLKSHLALVPQEYAFYMHLSVLQNLNFFAGFCRQSKQEQQYNVQKVMDSCQLDDYKNATAASLSGGYKRRLNLAIALLKNPKYLFLDEPTVGVDPKSRATIISLIKQLKQQGVTILYTSHLLSEVEDICEQTYVLNKGQLQNIQVANQSKNLLIHVTASLTQAQISKLTELFADIQIDNHQIQLVACSVESCQMLINRLLQLNISVDSINYESPTLHDLYMSLVK